MNAMSKWNPFGELDDIHNRLSGVLGKSLFKPRTGDRESMTLSDWAPAVDITEDDKEFLIKAEIPEVKKEDLNVSVENGVLSISGERKFEKETKDKKIHRVERSYGSFTRSFTLPDETNPEKVAAEFKEGLLRVHLPKETPAKPKAHTIKVS